MTFEVHFPEQPAHVSGAGRWRHAVVVFGNKYAVDAASYPGSRKPESFDFPEKSRLTGD